MWWGCLRTHAYSLLATITSACFNQAPEVFVSLTDHVADGWQTTEEVGLGDESKMGTLRKHLPTQPDLREWLVEAPPTATPVSQLDFRKTEL